MDVVDAGLLLLRLGFGMVLLAHGCRKLLGWFGGPGLERAGALFDSLGYRPGKVFVTMASGAEILGGLLLLSGLLWPVGPMMAVGAMLVAASTHRGFWASQGGGELPLAYAAVSTGLLLTGPGRAALRLWPDADPLEPWRWAALALAVAGAGVLMLYRSARVRHGKGSPDAP